MNIWFCSGCLEDVEGSVWDGFNQEDGRCYCEKCKVLHQGENVLHGGDAQ